MSLRKQNCFFLYDAVNDLDSPEASEEIKNKEIEGKNECI
jgi:hypothetical protein